MCAFVLVCLPCPDTSKQGIGLLQQDWLFVAEGNPPHLDLLRQTADLVATDMLLCCEWRVHTENGRHDRIDTAMLDASIKNAHGQVQSSGDGPDEQTNNHPTHPSNARSVRKRSACLSLVSLSVSHHRTETSMPAMDSLSLSSTRPSDNHSLIPVLAAVARRRFEEQSTKGVLKGCRGASSMPSQSGYPGPVCADAAHYSCDGPGSVCLAIEALPDRTQLKVFSSEVICGNALGMTDLQPSRGRCEHRQGVSGMGNVLSVSLDCSISVQESSSSVSTENGHHMSQVLHSVASRICD